MRRFLTAALFVASLVPAVAQANGLLASDIQVVTKTEGPNDYQPQFQYQRGLYVDCPAGFIAVSGSAIIGSDSGLDKVILSGSYPRPDQRGVPRGWGFQAVRVHDHMNESFTWELTGSVVCVREQPAAPPTANLPLLNPTLLGK
jgi:hypothetical protein